MTLPRRGERRPAFHPAVRLGRNAERLECHARPLRVLCAHDAGERAIPKQPALRAELSAAAPSPARVRGIPGRVRATAVQRPDAHLLRDGGRPEIPGVLRRGRLRRGDRAQRAVLVGLPLQRAAVPARPGHAQPPHALLHHAGHRLREPQAERNRERHRAAAERGVALPALARRAWLRQEGGARDRAAARQKQERALRHRRQPAALLVHLRPALRGRPGDGEHGAEQTRAQGVARLSLRRDVLRGGLTGGAGDRVPRGRGAVRAEPDRAMVEPKRLDRSRRVRDRERRRSAPARRMQVPHDGTLLEARVRGAGREGGQPGFLTL